MIHHADATQQSYWLKEMSLLITSHNQLALTSCVAQWLFGRLVFLGSNKSLIVAVECRQVLWNNLVLVEVIFGFWHSSLSILACFACTLRHGKGWLKAVDCGGEGLQSSPVFTHHYHFQQSAARLHSWRKGGKVSLTLALLMNSPVTEEGLLPEKVDALESYAAKLYSSWGENLLWIKVSSTSGLVFIPLLLCSERVLLIKISSSESLLGKL